jgi:hypothetical protein
LHGNWGSVKEPPSVPLIACPKPYLPGNPTNSRFTRLKANQTAREKRPETIWETARSATLA